MWKKFFKDRNGSFAIIFALSLLLLFITVGVAIDMARLSKEKQHIQDTLDATALAMVKQAIKIESMPKDELNDKINEFFFQINASFKSIWH